MGSGDPRRWGYTEAGAAPSSDPTARAPQHPQYEQCCLHLCSLSPAAPDRTTQSFFSLGLDEARETCQCLMKPHFHWLAPLKIFHLSVPRFKYFPLGGSQVCLVDYVARPFTSALTTLRQTLMSLLPPLLPSASPGRQSLDLFYFRPVLFQICFISDLSSSSAGRKRGGREGGGIKRHLWWVSFFSIRVICKVINFNFLLPRSIITWASNKFYTHLFPNRNAISSANDT